MTKIFINALSAKIGGGETYIKNLLKNKECNSLVYIVAPKNDIIFNDSRIKYLPAPFPNKSIFYRALWEFFYLPFLLNKLDIDVLFVPGGMDFTLKMQAVPKVTMFRNMLPFDRKAIAELDSKTLKIKNVFLKFLMKRTMNSAVDVVFISEYAKNAIIDELSLINSKVIHHGISENFHINKANINSGNGIKPYILYVSRFEPYKNHLNLIKAYSKLNERLKSTYDLYIIGEKMEPAYALCMEEIEKCNLTSNVKILGKQIYENLPAFYNECTIFVFPSSCENCPNILLEAMGCGCILLCSQTQPMPEFAGKAGVYFDEHNPDSIADSMQKVLENQELQDKLTTLTISQNKKYTWKNTANKTWVLINTIGIKNNV